MQAEPTATPAPSEVQTPPLPKHVTVMNFLPQVLMLWPELRDWEQFIDWWRAGNLHAFQAGEAGGVYMLHDFVAGHSAQASIWMRSKEYMGPEAVPLHREWVAWVMEAGQLQRLEARVPMYNTLGRRLCESVGFKREGVLQKAGVRDGVPVDVWVGAITREDHHG